MPSSIAASSELSMLDVKDNALPSSVDKRDSSKADSVIVASGHCRCGLCALSRKSESSTEGPCDHERQPEATAVSFYDMSAFKSEESYPDVPRTASALSLDAPAIYPDESSLDITITSPPGLHLAEASHTTSISDSVHHHTIHRDQQQPPVVSFTLANHSRSPSPRIFVQPASTQSNLSIATTQDAAFLAPPRPAPVPPAPNNMSLTFVPFFRRVEERDMIACQICLDEEPVDESVIIQSCGHSFGRECMRSYILSRLDERRFPIPCPCCSAADEAGSNPGLVTSGVATQCNLSDADCARWDELEFLVHAVRFECPKCLKSQSIDRRKLVKEKSKKKIHCITPGCQQMWCRNCQATVEPGEKQKHVCEGKKELKALLKKEGWRQCPGCNIPVQKSSGCNHIACSAPGCNTHFCYRCGQILIRSVFGSEIHHAISNHFRRRLYFWRCSQFHDPNVILRLITRGWRH